MYEKYQHFSIEEREKLQELWLAAPLGAGSRSPMEIPPVVPSPLPSCMRSGGSFFLINQYAPNSFELGAYVLNNRCKVGILYELIL